MCCEPQGYSYDEANGECSECGRPTVDGEACDQCGYSPVVCEACGAKPCDQSC